MCCHNSWILYLSFAFKKATQLSTSKLTILFIIKQNIFYLIISIPIEPVFTSYFPLTSIIWHWALLCQDRQWILPLLLAFFAYWVCVHNVWGFVHVCDSVHACVTLRWKHGGADSPHPSLPVFRRSHSNSRLLRSVQWLSTVSWLCS